MALKHYVTFYFSGAFIDEDADQQITDRQPPLEIPKSCHSYQFWDREEVESGGEILRGSKKNFSGMYYPDGKVFTLEEVQQQFPNERILISNMWTNKWEKVVRHRNGGFRPFEKKDVIV